MAKFDAETVARWTKMAADWMREAQDPGTVTDVYLGAEAWGIAHYAGITKEAYADPSVSDAHIVTALKQIFPKAVFKDRYVY